MMTGLGRFFAALYLVIASSVAGFAQGDNTVLDFEQWDRVSLRAAEAIEAGRASEVAMDALRQQLVEWRSDFREAQSRYSVAINTTKAKIDTLGPVPEGGDSAEVAAERARLEKALAEAREPVLRAQLAETEATELIDGVDSVVQGRRTAQLLERGPTPLNPALWSAAAQAVLQTETLIRNELRTAWDYEWGSGDLQKNLPRVIALLIVGAVLILFGRRWTDNAQTLIRREKMSGRRWVLGFLVSLGHLVLPLAGVMIVVEAFYASDLAGIRGDILLSNLPEAAFVLLFPIWLGRRLFPLAAEDATVLRLHDEHRREGRMLSVVTGAILAVVLLLQAFAGFETWTAGTRAVLIFPLILVAGVVMIRMATLLRAHAKGGNTPGEEGTASGSNVQIVRLLVRGYQIAALLGVLLAVAGYTSAATALVFPTMYTMQFIGFLVILHRGLVRVFGVLSGQGPETGEGSLWSVLLGFAIALASVPVVLLIWGARSQQLAEWAALIGEGLRFGEVTISPKQVLIFFAVFGIGYGLTRLLQGTLRNSVLPRTKIDVGGQNAIVSGVGYIGLTIAALIAIHNTGIDLGSIALVASALSIGIGFGLQTIVSNFVSGIILLIERPIAEGDWIEVGGQMGYVRDISVRSTRIETFDRTDVIIPNSDLVAGTVTNYTRGNTVGRVIVPVGVAYGTDPRKVEAILLEIAKAHPMVLANPAPYVVFQGFGASSLDFEIRAILRDVNWVLSVRSEMNYEIADRFVKEGIEIPFPQQDLWIRNPEALRETAQVEPVQDDGDDAVEGSESAPTNDTGEGA
ncbi:MAG: mechanosensitive ion channel family protein [Rhodobacteraceae bacterium]|nr:mechanosensitive ion channel family protein [Paracoccaceae bacterium]